MRTKRTHVGFSLVYFFGLQLLIALALQSAPHASAQDVAVEMSSRGSYVGMPIVITIRIMNAGDYELPAPFEIDGCNVRKDGAPSVSTRTTIINGHRTDSKSISMRYLITPTRPGTFEIPDFTVKVDGQSKRIRGQKFIASKSETGDLMFVEVVGNKKKVYVGEPLELTLKIWLKPYQNREHRVSLDEGQMWQMISHRSSWGKFRDRIEELSENRQRPGGDEVLKADENGDERSYFLYEIPATIYPDRPGKIDGSDIQIVADYPVKLGRSRDPFDSFFGDNDFFGRSPFGRRLSVTEVRPIVAETKVDAAEVMPIPSEGRPSDYRGAVGSYRIATDAEPTNVEAGDPITLRIGIGGDGPMDLIQAPPLDAIESLTNDFQVADQSLAGFVQDQNKVFVTSIRPKRAGITQVPPIPFTFFDPEKQDYVTVHSEPISISVKEAESLSLDSIVSNQQAGPVPKNSTRAREESLPDFDNYLTVATLNNPSTKRQFSVWYYLVVPPMIWLAIALVRIGSLLTTRIFRLRPAKSHALARVRASQTTSGLIEAIVDFINERTRNTGDSAASAVGALRVAGLALEANETESFLGRLANQSPEHLTDDKFCKLAEEARETIENLDKAIRSNRRSSIKAPKQNRKTAIGSRSTTASLILAVALTGSLSAQETESNTSDLRTQKIIQLVDDANRVYEAAQTSSATDAAQAKDLFSQAAQKFLAIAEQGGDEAEVFVSAANAFFQCGQYGQAIANYRRAIEQDPFHSRAQSNLDAAKSKLKHLADSANAPTNSSSRSSVWSRFSEVNTLVTRLIGLRSVQILAAISSFAFWILLSLKTYRPRLIAGWSANLALVGCLFLLVASVASIWANQIGNKQVAIVVAPELKIRDGDGEEFSTITELKPAEGAEVTVLAQRGNWVKVETSKRQNGWVKSSSVELISAESPVRSQANQ